MVVISAAAKMVGGNEVIRNLKNGKGFEGMSATLD
jgi:hypothetical protein